MTVREVWDRALQRYLQGELRHETTPRAAHPSTAAPPGTAAPTSEPARDPRSLLQSVFAALAAVRMNGILPQRATDKRDRTAGHEARR
jgi:hypothetical protein